MNLKLINLIGLLLPFSLSVNTTTKASIQKSATRLFQSESAFKAIFALKNLKQGPELLDPTNTATVSEYYLLENLSCGLIRDSKASATKYEGCIAERFYQSDPQTWIFKLRDLYWSDGSKLTKEDIVRWILRLQIGASRHSQFLKKLDRFSYNESLRELRLHFSEVDYGMALHEISLADAGLFPTDFKEKGWQRTIGPYSVETWDKSGNRLVLKANKYSPLFDKEMPEEVELRELTDERMRPLLFKSIKVDLALLSGFADEERTREMLLNAPQVYVCQPTIIVYFALNKNNPIAAQFKLRSEFAQIIRNIQSNYDPTVEVESRFKIEAQLIPEGFDGRIIQGPHPKVQAIENLKKLKVKISVTPAFERHKYIVDAIKKEFSRAGVEAEFYFRLSDSGAIPKDDFAAMGGFTSNQLDPSSSWSFLLYSDEGTLHPWLHEMRSKFQAPSSHVSNKEKASFFQDLHKEVLANYFAVPFLLVGQRYLMSDRVDASRWNRFDSRVRFYDLRIK